MTARKKRHHKKDVQSTGKSLSLSVVVPVFNDHDKLNNFLESIKKIKRPFEKDYQIIFPTPDPASIESQLQNIQGFENLKAKNIFRILPLDPDVTFSNAVKAGFNECIKENILICEINSLERTFNFDEIFTIPEEAIKQNKVILPLFRGQTIKSKSYHPIILVHRDLAAYFFSCNIQSEMHYQEIFFTFLHRLDLHEKTVSISQVSPFEPSAYSKPGLIKKLILKISLFIDWFFRIPLNEFRRKPDPTFDFLSVPSYFRSLFVIFALIIAILIPILSIDAGISGDEEKHYEHAEKVYNYYATKGEDESALLDQRLKLNYYGQSFDLFTYVFNKVFKVEKVYEARHVFIALTGFLAILFSGLLAKTLLGYRAGLITMVIMFFAPRFLGHSFNNPMDIPFAFGYIFTIFQIIRFLKKLPVFSPSIAIWVTLGIAYTISIRIGGLLLIPYAFFFAGLYLISHKWEFKLFSNEGLVLIRKGIIYLVLITVSSYFLSLLLWPYGLQQPLKNPFEALRMMANISVAIRVLFDGAIHWSNQLPWYYISMNILFTVPVVILAGFFLNLFNINTYKKHFKPLFAFFLFFAAIFPVAYVVYKESNVYGGWRHLLFVFPPIAILAGITYESLLRSFRKKHLKYMVAGLLVIGLFHPAKHIIANHPFEYIYFNEIMGNVNKIYGRFETDYYFNSLKQGSEWLIQNVLPEKEKNSDDKIVVAHNASIIYYFRDHADKVATRYTRYYERGASEWDYAIFFCNYIDPYQLKNNIWPPYKTIHTVKVDSVPICAVVKRVSKLDFEAIELADQKDFLRAIPMLERVIQSEPYNEIAMLKLAEAYILIGQFDMAHQTVNKCLAIYPDYDKALQMRGIAYMQNQEFDRAKSTFVYITTKVNYRFISAYHNLALICLNQNDPETAKNYLRRAIELNSAYKPAYSLMAEILNMQGQTEEANRYLEAAERL